VTGSQPGEVARTERETETTRTRVCAPKARVALGMLLGVLICFTFAEPAIAQSCDPWIAQVVSVQGIVEARRAGQSQWLAVRLNGLYCGGDAIRVRERSRAAVRLRNDAVLRLDEKTTISLPEAQESERSVIDVLRGLVYFRSRAPRAIKVRTPFVDGGVEGTEFLVEVGADRATITVLEGRVVATNAAGTLALSSGQSATARAGEAPVARVVVRPRDAVQWALYYPPVLDYRPADFRGGPLEGWQATLGASIQAYRDGDLAAAFARLDEVPLDILDPRLLTYRAGLLLTVGRVAEANAAIERALALDPKSGQALAIRSVIAVAQNDKIESLRVARLAAELALLSHR